MTFLCTITISVLMLGWLLNGGDPAWGRLDVASHSFPQPAIFTWVYLIPPLAILLLTQWGAPVSTSFLVLSTFEFRNSSSLIQISLSGYIVAFLIGVITYGLGFWVFERWVFESNQTGSSIGNDWLITQWLATAFLWGGVVGTRSCQCIYFSTKTARPFTDVDMHVLTLFRTVLVD
jgi:hypothetical protein